MSDAAYFLDPDGQVVAVDAAQAPLLAKANGYLPATPQQIEDYQATEKYGSGGQQAIAALEGLGRGLTARLSTPVEVALGVKPEAIAGREKAHPATALLSEVAGVGVGAATAGVPSLIGKAGAAVGGGIAGGAVEGALYGAGNVVHEAALGDPNLTAQSALAQVGVSAALGGGIGGVVGVAKSALPAAIGRAKSALGDLAEGIATPEKLKGLAEEQYKSVEGALRIANREIRPAEVAATITTAPGAAADEGLRLANRMGEVARNMRAQPELFPQTMFPAKLEAIRDRLLSDISDGPIFKAAIKDPLNGKIYAGATHYDALESMPAEALARLEAEPEAMSNAYSPGAWREGFVSRRGEFLSRSEAFAKLGGSGDMTAEATANARGPAAADIFSALNDAKQTLDKQLGKWGRFIAPEAQDAVGAIRGVRTELRTALENEAVWGPAGARQAAFNEAQSDYFDALKDFRKEFMLRKAGRGVQPDYSIDPGKLNRLTDTANPRYPMRQEVWDRYQEASRNLVDEIANSHANAPVGNYDKEALTGLIDKSGAMEQATRQQGSVLRMLGRMGGIGPMGTMAGGIVGGPAGAAIGAGVDVIAKGAKFIPRAVDALSHLNANNAAVAQAIESAAAKLASVAPKAAKAGRGEILAGLSKSFGHDAEEATSHFQKHADEIRQYTGNPATLQAALEEQAAGLHEHAPQTAQALASTSARAVVFLASKLPPTMQPGPLSEKLPVSQHDIAVFNRYREAVEDPLSVLRQANAGTLTHEGIEAVAAVYPHLYQRMQSAVLGSIKPEMPYRAKLMASMLLGKDLDGSTAPQSILRAQTMFQPAQQPMPKPKTPRKTGGSDRMLTSSQRAAGGQK